MFGKRAGRPTEPPAAAPPQISSTRPPIFPGIAWAARKTKPVCGILIFEAFDESTKTGPEYQRHYGLWTGRAPRRTASGNRDFRLPR